MIIYGGKLYPITIQGGSLVKYVWAKSRVSGNISEELASCLGEQISYEEALSYEKQKIIGKDNEGEAWECGWKMLTSGQIAFYALYNNRVIAKAAILQNKKNVEIKYLCAEAYKYGNAGTNLLKHIYDKIGQCYDSELFLESVNDEYYDKNTPFEKNTDDDFLFTTYKGYPKSVEFNANPVKIKNNTNDESLEFFSNNKRKLEPSEEPPAQKSKPSIEGEGITSYSKKQAKRLGVDIKPSTKKNKKIDVYKDGKLVASVGAKGYKDYPTYLKTEGKKIADERRKLYKKRHSPHRHKVGTPSYYADQLLW
jgi:hypothetical protein